MATERINRGKRYNLFKFLKLVGVFSFTFLRRKRTHDYTHRELGLEYLFEAAEAKAYMTGQGRGVRQGDHLLLKKGESVERYRIEEINYYASPPDMWMASLVEVVKLR